MRSPIKKLSLSGLLGALALVLAYIEGLFPPLPLLPPGAKLGLSNLVTMYAAGALGLPYALFVAVIKGLFSLFTRGYTAGLMSLCGGILSAFVLYAVLRYTKLSFVAVGVCGAIAHNFAQFIVSFALMGEAVVFYVPALLLFGILSGALTGLLLGLIYKRLRKIL